MYAQQRLPNLNIKIKSVHPTWRPEIKNNTMVESNYSGVYSDGLNIPDQFNPIHWSSVSVESEFGDVCAYYAQELRRQRSAAAYM